MAGHEPTQVRERAAGSSLSDEERAFLCDLLRSALVDIRGFARTKDSTTVLAIAEAFHNVPDFILRGGFSWDYFVAEFEALKATTGMGQYLDSVNAFLGKRGE
jgi:hypothetical protein